MSLDIEAPVDKSGASYKILSVDRTNGQSVGISSADELRSMKLLLEYSTNKVTYKLWVEHSISGQVRSGQVRSGGNDTA